MSIRDKLQVMVVDDMSTSRGLILQALDSFGLRNVQYASDGASALSSLGQRPVHLVISDYNMPGMSGLDLLAAMRGDARLARTGFILITGKADREIIDTGRRLGMNNFIKKPFEPKELLTTIEAVVGRL
jgi:two-component system chemotaxis response regulator CheY